MKRPEDWNLLTAQAWSVALTDLKMTQKEFALACQKSLSQEWFPTAPFDFLALARKPIEQNYPDMRQAYLNSANQNYPHAVVYETAKRVGFWELKSQPENQTWKAWQEIYPKVCQEHASGADFTLPMTQQVTYQPSVVESEKADDYLEQAMKILGGVA